MLKIQLLTVVNKSTKIRVRIFVKARNKHPNKEIEWEVKKAEEIGWRYQKAGNSSHAWGRLLCPMENREGCSLSIWSTPRCAENHARQIRNRVNACPHLQES